MDEKFSKNIEIMGKIEASEMKISLNQIKNKMESITKD
jgi:hypothetical protein